MHQLFHHLRQKRLYWGVSLLLMIGSGSVWSLETEEYDLKAAFLYNFASYTAWPEAQQGPFQFCIFGADLFGSHLDQLKAVELYGQPIRFRFPQRKNQLVGCQLLYIAPTTTERLSALIRQLGTAPVLTITDMPHALEHGAMINMVKRESRIAFEISQRAALNHGLKIDAKLLRFAVRVVQ